jgi:hypothetical protein
MQICYERAEPLCHSLNRPLLLYVALMGQWRYSLNTDKLTATMRLAERVYSLAQEQNDSDLLMGACRPLAVTFYYLGDFETARQYAMRSVQIWRSGTAQSPGEEVDVPAVGCLCVEALCEWHSGEISSCHSSMGEAVSLAKKLNDMHGLAVVLCWAAILGYSECNPAQVERYASDLIELSTRHNFAYWLAVGAVLGGWARSAPGDAAEGISWIEDGIRDYRATGSIRSVPFFLRLKAEALYLADRIPEALEAVMEAEALAERNEERCHCAELHRLKGVFLTAMGAEEAQIEAPFRAAIRIAREQKSVSLEKRAEGTYAEYRRQKASASGGRGFRLPIC